MLDNYCAEVGFEKIVFAPGKDSNGAATFDNFEFVIFKFPQHEKGNESETRIFL